MGKWVEKGYDGELVRKMKCLFEEVAEKLNREQPDIDFTFENFVESFDETDKFNRRLFEFFVKVSQYKFKFNSLSNDYTHGIIIVLLFLRKLRKEDCEGALARLRPPARMATRTCMLPAVGTLLRAITATCLCLRCRQCLLERSTLSLWSRK